MTDLHMLLLICGGMLFMAWCIFGNKNKSYCVRIDKAKGPDPRKDKPNV